MSLSETPETTQSASPARARLPFPWIERVALPIMLSVMEAQPLALIVILLTQIVAGENAAPPVSMGGIILLELGLTWWTMLVDFLVRRVVTKDSTNTLQISGWIIALAALLGPSVPSLLNAQGIPQALILLALTTWLWRRGIVTVQFGFEYSRVATSFKIGLGIILGVLFVATLVSSLRLLHDALPITLPIFFLSGLIALSLTRLGALRAVHRTSEGTTTDPTHSWLLALTVFGAALIILVIIIESIFSFSALEGIITALNPLWSAINTVLNWILYGLVFLLSPIFYLASFLITRLSHGTAKPYRIASPISSRNTPGNYSPALLVQLLAVGKWVVLALILIAIFAVVAATMRRWFRHREDDGIDEVREGLDVRSLMAQRLREWLARRRRQTTPAIQLEPLDPMSARARYRELLQEAALANESLARQPNETPGEYQLRLSTYLREQLPAAQRANNDTPPAPPVMLDTLTQAYMDERYGGKSTSEGAKARLQDWTTRLITRLTGKPPRRARP